MLSRKTHLNGLIIALLVVSSFIFAYRYILLGVPLSPEQEVKSWAVEASLKFYPQQDKPLKVSLNIPNMPPYFAVLDEYFVANNYGVNTSVNGLNRQAVWAKRRAKGLQTIYYRAIFRHVSQTEPLFSMAVKEAPIALSDTKKSAALAIVDESRKLSADIETFTIAAIKALHKNSDNVRTLVGVDASDESRARATQIILQQANIKSVLIKGFNLHQGVSSKLVTWLAVNNDKQWFYVIPETAKKASPDMFLVWQYGDKSLFQLSGGTRVNFAFTVSPSSVAALHVAKIRGTQTQSTLMKFSLLQLPLSVQQTYEVLLTIPIGAFVILLLRNFIGLITFGTFMPVLVALAFRETHLLWGAILFSTIVSLGLGVRFYLDQLHLLVVPRLAVILTVVIFLMLFISIVGFQLGFPVGLSISLFPMVILTMVIERMCVMWDERGAFEAIKTGFNSLIAASLAFIVMNNHEIQYLLFAFPELLILLMALFLIFGQYRGYRLLELKRFKALSY